MSASTARMLPIEDSAPELDRQRMLAVQAGDRKAFRELWDRWHGLVFQFLLRRTGRRSTAEDALQRTWIKVWRHRESYDGTRAFKPWLYTIAVNSGRDAWRAEAGLWDAVPLDPATSSGSNPERAVHQRRLVGQALHALGGRDRRALLLAVEGFTAREIAEMLGMKEVTVRVRLHRARARIRARVEGGRDG